MLAIVASINFVVDPHGRYRAYEQVGFNELKMLPSPETRQGKANALQQCEYGTVILGSSRAETGLNPASREFTAQPVYNAALVGTSMREILSMAEFFLAKQSPEVVVLGLDFLVFNVRRDTAADYLDSVLHDKPSLLSNLSYLLSIDNLIAALITVDWNAKGIVSRCYFDGHNDQRARRVVHRNAFDEILTSYIRNPTLYGNYELSGAYLEKLETLLRLMIEEGVELKIFVSPMHVVQLELLNEIGLMPGFEDWKRRLVEIVTRLNAESSPTTPLSLWDFSGYSTITTESVPERGSDQQMQWFRDSAHYRVATGDLILRRLLHPEAATSTLPEDFGIVLTPVNIESFIAQEQQKARHYRLAEPAEVSKTRKIAEKLSLLWPNRELIN